MSVPKLRFKEFKGECKVKKLGEIFEITSGTTPFRGTEAFFKDGHHYWIKTTDLNNSLIKQTQEKVTDLALKETCLKLLPEGTVLVAMYGGFNQIGRTGLLTKKAAINQALSAILPKLELVNPYYLLTYLNYHVEDWKTFAASSRKDPNITKNDVKNFNISFPTIPEQTKIANFLIAIDEKIAQLTQKHELLARYKKGVMQQLFSQELRFKDDGDRIFPDWEDKKIKDFLISHKGGAPLTPSDFVKNSDYEVIPKKAISSGGNLSLSLSEGTFCSERFFNNNLKSVVDDSYLITTLRDLVPSGPTIGYIVKFKSYKSYILAQGVYGIKIDKKLDQSFLIHYSNTDMYRQMMQTMMVGSTQVHIRNNDFFETPIKRPSLAEQIKIAAFLTEIDEKITYIQAQIDTVKQYKQGLLQQMFI